MGFSIASSVLGGIIVTFYSMAMGDNIGYSGHYKYDARMAICAVILTLGIGEFIIGIWAAVCCCLMKPFTCCVATPPPEVRVTILNAKCWLDIKPTHSLTYYLLSTYPTTYLSTVTPTHTPTCPPTQPLIFSPTTYLPTFLPTYVPA